MTLFLSYGTKSLFCGHNRGQMALSFAATQRRWVCHFAVQEAAMYRRLLILIAMSLALSACVPYYEGGSGYRSEVYTSPAPYYGGYRSYEAYPRRYYAPPPRYYQARPRYRPAPDYHPGHGPRYDGGGRNDRGNDRDRGRDRDRGNDRDRGHSNDRGNDRGNGRDWNRQGR